MTPLPDVVCFHATVLDVNVPFVIPSPSSFFFSLCDGDGRTVPSMAAPLHWPFCWKSYATMQSPITFGFGATPVSLFFFMLAPGWVDQTLWFLPIKTDPPSTRLFAFPSLDNHLFDKGHVN